VKRLILHFMCAILVVSAFCAHTISAIALTPAITISDKTCNPGQEISLPVSLEETPGIMYLSLTPKCYDEEGEETDYLTLADVENGELFSLEKGLNLVFDSNSDVTDGGTLCTLKIQIAEDAPFGEYTVDLILRECYNGSEQDVELEVNVGTVTVEKPHVAAKAVIENRIPATCTKNGSYESVVYCADCGEELSRKTEILSKTGHTEVTLKAKAATCESTGLTAGKKCSKCNTVLIPQKKVAKKAHSYENKVTKATASKNGKIVKKCKVCDYIVDTTTIYAAKTIKLSKEEYVYSGKTIKPTIVVKTSKGKTVSDDYYTVSGTKSAKNIGSYRIKVVFKGRYSGTKYLYYTISPRVVSGLKLKSPAKKQLTVSWKKDSSVGGYQIVYATNSKFTKSKKTITVKSYSTYKQTIKKLSSKKIYYVKVRAFKKVGGNTLYGEFSKAAKLKIK